MTMQQENTANLETGVPYLKAWIVCLAAGLFFFYDFIQMNMFNTLNPYVAKAFRLNAIQIGNLAATYLAATVLMLPFSGALLDQYPTRKVILSAMSVCTFSTFLFAITSNIWVAGLARFICGGSTAFCFLSCIVLASRWFPPTKMAQVTGVVVTMAMLGGAMSQEPLAQLIQTYGWRETLIMDTFLGIALFFVMYCLIENYPNEKRPPQPSTEPMLKSYIKAARNLQNTYCGLYTSLMNLFVFILGAVWGVSYLQHVYHLDHTTASRITTLLFIGSIIGSPLAGYISDKIKRRKSLMISGAVVSFLLSFLLLIFPQQFNVTQLSVIFFALGLTTSTQILTYPVIFESNPPHMTGTSEGLAAVFIMSGGAIFQPLFGWMMSKHWNGLEVDGLPVYAGGDYHFAYLLLPISLLVCIWLASRVRETHCQLIWKNQEKTSSTPSS